jgi:hypothetical protein
LPRLVCKVSAPPWELSLVSILLLHSPGDFEVLILALLKGASKFTVEQATSFSKDGLDKFADLLAWGLILIPVSFCPSDCLSVCLSLCLWICLSRSFSHM